MGKGESQSKEHMRLTVFSADNINACPLCNRLRDIHSRNEKHLGFDLYNEPMLNVNIHI